MSFHIDVGEIPTYKRGKDQIDTTIVSTALIPYIHQPHMLAYDRLCLSDHHTMCIDIDLKKYIKTKINIKKQILRGITSKHPTIIHQYKEMVYNTM